MKNRRLNSIAATALLAIIVSFLTVAPSYSQQKQSAQALFTQGLELYKKKQYEQALVNFETVLKRSPNSLYARSYIGKCKAGIVQGGNRNKDVLKEKLTKIVIPSLIFTEAPIGDVLDYLSQRTVELTNNKVTLNFIYRGTSEQRHNTLVTLNLKNVPMTQAIHYVSQVTHTAMKYEEHAVVADPNGHVATAGTEAKKNDTKIFGQEPAKSPFSQ